MTESVVDDDDLGDCTEGEDELLDWQLPLCFMKKRHKEKIEGSSTLPQLWKMKEKMRTVSVALVLCLNIGVDPPDVVKTNPCARMECWKDPLALNPDKALNIIANALQHQYEQWQPKARYRHNLDPTVDDVKKLCTSLRRNAKEEHVLFHYNGHGVPRPTHNGEIWVFNKQYTQYIPLSLYDLQTWMGSPSIYVYDCSNAGLIVHFFNQFARQRESEYESALSQGSALPPLPPVRKCIQMAACGPDELLPMQPDLPADLFTACLTSPVKVALRWFVSQKSGNLVPKITLDLIEKIPGQLTDRRTPLGELNWILTAITDTIAWNILPTELFKKLFRQDLLLASLFRNYLLAERVMRSYNCTPVTCPKLPSTFQHPLWMAWDLAVDQCLSQLPVIIKDEGKYKNSTFFSEQLTAFQVWLAMGNEKRDPPEQLPIVLQVLLSQVHRLRALDLLGRFIDLGPWAVSRALSMGIFPYILKLLQSTSKDLRPLMVFIWAKILAVDCSFQADLVKENGHKYFLYVLADPYMPAEHRTTSSFVLARVIQNHPAGQEACLKGNMISICLEQLIDPHPLLRQWLALCLGLIWTNCDAARWCGIRDSAPDKLSKLLTDPLAEVRAAAVFALGKLIGNTGDRSDHANMVDHGVATTLASTVANDGSPLVRKELVAAFYGMIVQFENAFCAVAVQFLEEDRQDILASSPARDPETKKGWILVAQGGDSAFMTSTDSGTLKRHGSTQQMQGQQIPAGGRHSYSRCESHHGSNDSGENIWLRQTSNHRFSSSPMYSLRETVYTRVWKAMLNLSVDPYTEVADMAKKVVNHITVKATITTTPRSSGFTSMPSSPGNTSEEKLIHKSMSTTFLRPSRSSIQTTTERPKKVTPSASTNSLSQLQGGGGGGGGGVYKPHSIEFSTKRKMFGKGPDIPETQDSDSSDSDDEGPLMKPSLRVETQFYEWCCNYFAQSVMKPPDDHDPSSQQRIEREWRFLRNTKVRQLSQKQLKEHPPTRMDDEIFINKNPFPPSVLKFHPYLPHVAVADKYGVSVWDYVIGTKLNRFHNGNPKTSRITSMDILNAHDISLLLTGSDDGAVRVWRNYNDSDEGKVHLVTAWTALSGMIPSYKGTGSGLVTDWEQQSGMLMASGDVRVIRVWDAHREMKVQDIPTGADSCVSSMSCDSVSHSLLVTGLGDGSVRLYDRRLPPDDCRVMTLREHGGWVLKVFLSKKSEGSILSGSVDGSIKIWDTRMANSLKTISNTLPKLTCIDFHQQADLIACGSGNQSIKVLKLDGEQLSHIRYHDGFIGQRIGPLNCLSFHPYWPYLAAGSMDSFLSMYSTEKPITLKLEDITM